MFILRQYLVPKHSSRVPAPLSLLALPLSLSASPHPLRSHWPSAFPVALSSPAFELSPTLFPLLPCPPLSLLLISRISVYITTSAGRLPDTRFLAPAGALTMPDWCCVLERLLSHWLSLDTVGRLDGGAAVGRSVPGRMPSCVPGSTHWMLTSHHHIRTTKNVPKVPWEQKHPPLRTAMPASSKGMDYFLCTALPKLACNSRSLLIICCVNEQKCLL